MSRQNAEEEKSTLPASKIVWGRQKIHPAVEITPWQSRQKALPTEKLIQALWRSKNDESQIIWHKWGNLPCKKKKVNRGFVQPRLSQECLVSLALSQSFAMQWACLSFILMQIKNCTGSSAVMYTRPPDGWKWTYVELQQPGVWQQNQSRKKPT